MFSYYQFTLYGSLELTMSSLVTNLVMFRASSVVLDQVLGRGNMISVMGEREEEIQVVRETLASRWPYLVVSDQAVSEGHLGLESQEVGSPGDSATAVNWWTEQ